MGRKGRLFSHGDMARVHRVPSQHESAGELERLSSTRRAAWSGDPVDKFAALPVPPNQDVVLVVQEKGQPAVVPFPPVPNRIEPPRSPPASPDAVRRFDSHIKSNVLRRMETNRSPHTAAQPANVRPWEFSLIESPITPLRSRTLASTEDGKVVMAMWRGLRVSVKVIRRDRARFYREGDYLYALGQSPNIPSLLGGHWENAAKPAKTRSKGNKRGTPAPGLAGDGSANVGFLVMEVANGVSLDKLVRDGKMTDMVSQIRVLDRVVAALVYAQKVDRSISHQDIHPGNILLVPSTATTHVQKPGGNPGSITGPESSASSSTSSIPRTRSSLSKVLSPSSTVEVSDTTVDDSSTAVNIVDPRNSTRQEAVPEGDIIFDEFGSMQKKGQIAAGFARVPLRPGKGLRSTTETASRPQIPKVEEVKEALTVLQRVALHNKLDAAAVSEADHPHSRKPDLVKATPSPKVVVESAKVARHGKLSRSSTVAASIGTSSSFTSVDGRQKDNSSTTTSNSVLMSTVSSYTVKVMDFAPALESDGMRRTASWTTNESIAGYCAPEKATANMWRKMQHNKEKERERERERERDRERRAMMSRGVSNGRHSPRPSSRRRSSNGVGAGNGVHTTRSGSGSSTHHRRTFDSETYALFGDDNLVDINDTDEDLNDDASLGGDSATPASPKANRPGRSAPAKSPDAFREEVRYRPDRAGMEVARLRPTRGSSEGVDIGKDASSKRSSDISTTSGTKDSTNNPQSKIDVWSIGWLLYYMSTRKHPPRDSWARRAAIDSKEFRSVPPELREIIQMCIERDVAKRACMRDVKRQIDSILQGLMFAKGLALLETEREAGFVLLDKAVGIRSPRTRGVARSRAMSTSASLSTEMEDASRSGTDHMSSRQILGLNQKTRLALACLPLPVVRRVEWEAAARYLKRSEEELRRLRKALVNERWGKPDVQNGDAAVKYLQKLADEGVASAQSALGWVYRWGAGGAKKDVAEAIRLWEKAERLGDAEASNGLGLVYHHGREGVPPDGDKARRYYEDAVEMGYVSAAVNLGAMLHNGSAGVAVDGIGARRLYEMAVRGGDAIAANNLGLLLQHGAAEVKRDAGKAVEMYEIAIARGERLHACRNLAELLWDGAEGVPQSRANAVEYFRQAVERGDSVSRKIAREKIRRVLERAEREDGEGVERVLLERCWRLLEKS